jgi:hypothetical protein
MQLQKTTSRKSSYILTAAILLSSGISCHTPMSARTFLSEVNRDRDAAYEKYKDKDILLMGMSTTPREEENGDIILGLDGGDDLQALVICRFEKGLPQVRDELLRIKSGEWVNVKCRLRRLQTTRPALFMEKCQL